ncbi:NUDIX hydrolase [Streptococcus oricebi]|uniref:ADP-ribose pyrophosphatase n=1 Tax=Streptococcus oricebi TaxID=1547447 RepID=A0ABS5B1J2_9STRE|nr:NUDIX hydrolase [Streptococcus oricebi]MBP2622625.1 ADP-ribose pyrophosphatase [Streptococcus oricebi]
MEFEEKTIKRTEIFSGQVVHLVVDDVQLPEGKGQSKRELIFHNGAVAVIAVTPENKLILVKQYRKAIEATSYEIPAGKLEVGENADPKAAALRELEEETGYTADLELVYDFYTAIGFCNEKIKLYSAQDLIKVENPRPQDEDETLELYQVSLAEAKELLASGQICDAKTIMALQYWEMKENLKK